jgi:ABC-type transport system involved in cytochrome c biogenesis ATPase subunit
MLQTLSVKNFSVFGQATLSFGALNVLHGDNGAGKTHLLKLLWALLSAASGRDDDSDEALKRALHAGIIGAFGPLKGDPGRIARRQRGTALMSARVSWLDGASLGFSNQTGRPDGVIQVHERPKFPLGHAAPVFLPPRELLSLGPARDVGVARSLDAPTLGACRLLERPLKRGPRDPQVNLLAAPIEAHIGAQVVLDDEQGFFLRAIGTARHLEVGASSAGQLKLGTLARLMLTHHLLPGATLLIDGADEQLNPRAMRVMAAALARLARSGVQVFVSAHSAFMLRALAHDAPASARFFGLSLDERGESQIQQGATLAASGEPLAQQEEDAQIEGLLAAHLSA